MKNNLSNPKSISVKLGFLIILIGFTVSCKKEQINNNPQIISQETLISDKYKTAISSFGFRTDSLKDCGDFILAEGDVIFSKKELDKLLTKKNSVGNKIDQAITSITLSRSAVSTIKVFVDPSIPLSGVDNWWTEITTAMNHWNNLQNSVVTMTSVSSSSSANIIVKSDAGALPDGVIAAAEFPLNGNSPGTQIRINLDFNSNQTVPSGQKIYNMVHELGHCISFRHTNWEGLNETGAFNIGHGVPNSDPNSVMNGATAGNSWNGFSSFDILATELIYPQWADYVQLGGANWYNTDAMTSLNGYIYAVNNSRFYRINANNGSYVQLGGAVWSGTNAMTSVDNYIYLVQNSRLYRVDPTNGSYVQLGGAVWTGTNAMTSIAGDGEQTFSMLYIVQNSRLYRVDPNSGSYTQLGGAVWVNTEAMCSLNNYIYQVQNSRLYRVNPTNGSYVQLGGAVWAGTAAMSSVGSYLYIIENDIYHKVSPTDGSYTKLGGIVWSLTDGMASIGTYNYIIENSRFYKANSL